MDAEIWLHIQFLYVLKIKILFTACLYLAYFSKYLSLKLSGQALFVGQNVLYNLIVKMAPNMSEKRQFSQTCHIILDKSPEITMHNHLNHVTVAGVHKFKMAN